MRVVKPLSDWYQKSNLHRKRHALLSWDRSEFDKILWKLLANPQRDQILRFSSLSILRCHSRLLGKPCMLLEFAWVPWTSLLGLDSANANCDTCRLQRPEFCQPLRALFCRLICLRMCSRRWLRWIDQLLRRYCLFAATLDSCFFYLLPGATICRQRDAFVSFESVR